jgi:hypothetical protein
MFMPVTYDTVVRRPQEDPRAQVDAAFRSGVRAGRDPASPRRRARMTTSVRRLIVVSLCIAASSASLLGAQERSHYRTYQMGDDLLSIARQIGVAPPRANLLPHSLGAVLELTWRAQYVRRGVVPPADPVARLVFSFYEDQLFRIVIDYERDRTEGMTEADMVAGISEIYGQPSKRTLPPSPVGLPPERDVDTVIAQWVDGDYSIALLGVESQAAFRMIVASARLEALARAAGGHAVPTYPPEMTSVDVARPNADVEKTRPAREKTRRANIASFTP